MVPPCPRRVRTEHHRSHRLEVHDDRGEGWIVVIYGPDGVAGRTRDEIRSGDRSGLVQVLVEARRRIDQRLDGSSGLLGPRRTE